MNWEKQVGEYLGGWICLSEKLMFHAYLCKRKDIYNGEDGPVPILRIIKADRSENIEGEKIYDPLYHRMTRDDIKRLETYRHELGAVREAIDMIIDAYYEVESKVPITDTERLDFILKYFCIDDVGDEEYIPGVCINEEKLADELSIGIYLNWDDNLRDVIDRAIMKHREVML